MVEPGNLQLVTHCTLLLAKATDKTLIDYLSKHLRINIGDNGRLRQELGELRSQHDTMAHEFASQQAVTDKAIRDMRLQHERTCDERDKAANARIQAEIAQWAAKLEELQRAAQQEVRPFPPRSTVSMMSIDAHGVAPLDCCTWGSLLGDVSFQGHLVLAWLNLPAERSLPLDFSVCMLRMERVM